MSNTVIERPRFSCALAAQQTVLAIPGGIPIVHAGPGCSSKAGKYTQVLTGHSGEGYAGRNHVSCTNTGEKEVVFGGEKNLEALLNGTLQVIKGDLYVALSGCTAGIIGDDVQSVARRVAEEQDAPLVGVETAGFKGTNYYGHEVVMKGIIDQYVGKVEAKPQAGLVNVFSVVPTQNPYWRGDLEAIKSLLEKIGLKVNILFGTESDGVSEWKNIPNAQFNLLLSPWVGLSTVQHLEKKYGTPYLHYPVLPVGGKQTSEFLRTVGEYAGIDSKVVEAVIAKEEKRFYQYFVNLADFVSELSLTLPYELYLVADSEYALGVTDYLVNELGFEPRGIYITDDPTPEKEQLVRDALKGLSPEAEQNLKFLTDGGPIDEEISAKIGTSKRALILGSYWERKIAKETGNFFVHLSIPISDEVITSTSYVGYEGGLRLIEKIYTETYNRGVLSSRTVTE